MYKTLKEQFISVKEIKDKSYLVLNGNYVGKLDNKIVDKLYNIENKLTKIKFIDNEENYYNVQIFINELPLIIDSLKNYFYVNKTRYNIGEIDNKKYLFYESTNEIPFTEFNKNNKESELIKSHIRKIIIFQYLMCIKPLNSSIENNIFVKSNNSLITKIEECDSLISFYTFNENDYYMDINKSPEIPKILINSWFNGDLNFFNECIKQNLNGIDANTLRNKLNDIVSFYNSDYKCWINSVFNRVLNLKYIE